MVFLFGSMYCGPCWSDEPVGLVWWARGSDKRPTLRGPTCQGFLGLFLTGRLPKVKYYINLVHVSWAKYVYKAYFQVYQVFWTFLLGNEKRCSLFQMKKKKIGANPWLGTMGYVRGVSTERGSDGGIANGQVNKIRLHWVTWANV